MSTRNNRLVLTTGALTPAAAAPSWSVYGVAGAVVVTGTVPSGAVAVAARLVMVALVP